MSDCAGNIVKCAEFQKGIYLVNNINGFLQIYKNVCTQDNKMEIEFKGQNNIMNIHNSKEESKAK